MNQNRRCHKNNTSISVTIPSDICRRYQIECGTTIEFNDVNGVIELRVLKPITVKDAQFEADNMRDKIRQMHENGTL